MDSEPSSSSGTAKRLLCICRKHCNGQPRLVSVASFYRHLRQVKQDSDEYHKILTFKTLSIDAAHALLTGKIALEGGENLPKQAGPSTSTTGMPRYARRMEVQRALVKRAREAQPDPRAGKRKCARKVENDIPPVSVCAHWWLRAFKDSETTEGTLSEFNQCYEALSKEQQQGCDKEAQDLVAKDAWNKDTFNGVIH